jgi:outer membrane lipoprotein carrier protein
VRRNLPPLGISLTCALLFFTSGINAGSTPDLKRLVGLFESRYKSAHTLQATFLERYSENGRFVRAESGTAFFRRPGKMRWEYQSPEKNLFLIDGKTAWFYVPADHTATRVPAKESTDWRTPLALLAGEMKVSRICAQIQLAPGEAPEDPGNAVLSCQLRGVQPNVQESRSPKGTRNVEEPTESVFFEVVRNSGELVRVLVRNSGGVGIEFQFRNWRYDPSVDESLFRFTVPRGVAIVNGESPAGDSGINP